MECKITGAFSHNNNISIFVDNLIDSRYCVFLQGNLKEATLKVRLLRLNGLLSHGGHIEFRGTENFFFARLELVKVNGRQCFSALTFGTNKMRRVTVAVI